MSKKLRQRVAKLEAANVELRRGRARLMDLVTIHDGNTEVNEVYLEVLFLGYTIWSGGGRAKETQMAAEEERQKFIAKLDAAMQVTEIGGPHEKR